MTTADMSSKRRLRRVAATVVGSLVFMMSVGAAGAAACVWQGAPTPGTTLNVRTAPSQSAQTVGRINDGQEFYGSCSTVSGGWIEVTPGNWPYQFTGNPPYDYVNSAYARKLS